jgi:hypothetical protein
LVWLPDSQTGRKEAFVGRATSIDFTGDLFGSTSVSGVPTATPPPRTGRYSLNAARKEIVKVISQQPRGTKKRLAISLGLEPDGLSHRLSGRFELTIEQIGVIADELDAPTGWPWIPWDLGEAFDAAHRAWNARK